MVAVGNCSQQLGDPEVLLDECGVKAKMVGSQADQRGQRIQVLAQPRGCLVGFPGPMSSAGWTLYSWAQVRPWFAHHAPACPPDQELLTAEHDRLIAAADHLVRARALMRGDRLADGLAALISA